VVDATIMNAHVRDNLSFLKDESGAAARVVRAHVRDEQHDRDDAGDDERGCGRDVDHPRAAVQRVYHDRDRRRRRAQRELPA
jgi:hypothetical protein